MFGTVYAVTLQPDGYILIGGGFIESNWLYDVARLQPDGTVDSTFNPSSDLNNSVRAILVQPDEKVIIGGDFTTVPALFRNRIARLNSNGSGDDTFDPGTGSSSTIRSLALQPDGKILLGGPLLDSINHPLLDRVGRLNANGSVDASFTPGTIQNYAVYCLMLQTDGKVLGVSAVMEPCSCCFEPASSRL